MTKTPEEKPYLQDLFDHMRNEHNLILTQSEMQEIISVVQQSLTTESVVKENLTSETNSEKPNLIAEERAREYAERLLKLCEHTIDKQSYRINYFNADDIEQAYLYGSSQLAAYREALKHLTAFCDFESMDEVVFYEQEHNISFDTALAKAKQLIEEKL